MTTPASADKAELAAAIKTIGRLAPQHLSLDDVDLSGADLTEANLSGATFSCANLSGANLAGASLIFVRFVGAEMAGVNLTGADLHLAKMGAANLTKSDMSGADLRGVDFTGANLWRVKLDGAHLSIETKWPDNFTGGRSTITKMFPNAQLDACKQAGSRLDAVKMMARVATIPDLETLDWVAETIRLDIFGDTSVRDDMSGEVLLGVLEDSDV